MTKREFATLLFRLLGLYFIGQSFYFVPAALHEWMNFQSGNLPFVYLGVVYAMLIAGSPFVLLSGFGFLLFVCAPAFSVGVFKDEQPLSVKPELADLRAAAFIVAGLILVGNAIPTLLGAFVDYRFPKGGDAPSHQVVAQTVKLILGLYFLNCGGWRLVPPQQWGRDPDWPKESSSDAEP